MTREANVRLVRQISELCTFLPTVAARPEFARLRLLYERGGKHMLDSENMQRIVDSMQEHARELRKLGHLLALECHVNLAKHSPPGQR
jgi:hypothetical protein